MVDNDLLGKFLEKFFSITGAAFVAAMAFIAHLFRVRNERLRDIAVEKTNDWERLRHERNVACEERDLVRDRWAQCEAQALEWKSRAIAAEAYLLGLGMGKNEAATQAAAERIASNGKLKDGGTP